MSKQRTGMEHSRNTAAPSKSEPTLAEFEGVAMRAEINAIRKEYETVLKICNAVQLSFLALARALKATPLEVAQALANENANKAFEQDATRELGRIRTDIAKTMSTISKS